MSDPLPGKDNRPVPLQNWSRGVLYAVVAVGIVYLAIRLEKVLLMFYLATLFGMAINPAILWLERRKIHRPLAVGGLMLIVLTGVASGAYLVAPPAADQAQQFAGSIPGYYKQLQALASRTVRRYPDLQQNLNAGSSSLQDYFNRASGVLGRLGVWFLGIGDLAISGFLVLFLVIFGLLNPAPMARALFDLTPAAHHERLEHTLALIQEKIVAWVIGTFILMAIIGIAVWIGMILIGVQQALLFGVLAAIGEGIPTIGPILSAGIPLVVVLLTTPLKAVWVLLLFLVVQQLENNIVVPMVMGTRLNVHPWALIFMILVMGEMFGVVGLFLAMPTTAILGVIYTEWVPKPGRDDPVPTLSRVARVFGGPPGES